MDDSKTLNDEYWNTRYLKGETGWDVGSATPALTSYFNTITDKSISILIPGCGNAYEAEYLLKSGFTNITLLDISEYLTAKLAEKFKGNTNIKIICNDFFTHEGIYDLIVEQTFFCALPVSMRLDYVNKMWQLLKPKGILAGVFFGVIFDKEGPPFGGLLSEYIPLFSNKFEILEFGPTTLSIPPRLGSELFAKLRPKK